MTTAKIRNRPFSKVNSQKSDRKEVTNSHLVINDIVNTLFGILPYIVAIYIGITFRTVILACKGYDYTINGMDLLNAVLCVAMVITVKFIRKNAK